MNHHCKINIDSKISRTLEDYSTLIVKNVLKDIFEKEKNNFEEVGDMLPDLQNIEFNDVLYNVSDALINERTKCLYWMKKYNLERNQRHILSLEIDELRIKTKLSLSELIEKGGEVNEIMSLYKSELSRLQILEGALKIEKENVMKLISHVNWKDVNKGPFPWHFK